MEKERLTWQEIKDKYPHRYVGLINIEHGSNSISVKKASVLCTDKDKTYEEMLKMAKNNEIDLRYTTADEDDGII